MKVYGVLNKECIFSDMGNGLCEGKNMQRNLGTPYISHSHLLVNSTKGGASGKLCYGSFYVFLYLVFSCFSLKLFRATTVCRNSSHFVQVKKKKENSYFQLKLFFFQSEKFFFNTGGLKLWSECLRNAMSRDL